MVRAQAVAIVRVEHGTVRTDQDLVAREAPLDVTLRATDGRSSPAGLLMRTPGDDRDLVYGWLRTEQIIREITDVSALNLTTSDSSDGTQQITSRATVELAPAIDLDHAISHRSLAPTSACGLCGRLGLDRLDASHGRVGSRSRRWPIALIAGLPSMLQAAQTVFAETGGLHAAGLVDNDGRLGLVREDVGRHNAVDKAIGAALLSEQLRELPILVVSGRVAFEIVQKAAIAGLAAVVAVGAPSDMAIAASRETGLTLVGFTRADRFNVYAGADRIREVDAHLGEDLSFQPVAP